MIAEGKLTIDLGANVRIRSNRTASVAALMVGRETGEALALLPVVFSLCAHAHVAAARMAMGEAAQDGQSYLVLAENAREHLLRIMLGWKGEGPALMPPAPVMALVPDMGKAIENHTISHVADGLCAYLETHVLGCAPELFLHVDFADWLTKTDTPAAAYLRMVSAKNWQGLGRVAPAYLPDLPAADLALRLQQDGYCLHPDWLGEPCETGPLARQKDIPLIATLTREFGAGLLARLVARLVELAQIPAQMRQVEMPASASASVLAQAGMGVVETARGRLVHMSEVRDGTIQAYKILAPTEWNFHPQGVAAQALSGLNTTEARAVIEAIDPCVDFELRAA